MDLRLCLLSLIYILGVSAQERTYKMCVTESQASTNDCQILRQAKSRINCVNVKDSTDCALKLQKGEADFGIFTAEEAILMSKFDKNQDRKVVAEIREKDRNTEKFKFETVVIIKGNFTGPLSNLRKKNFCHPGFSKSQVWTERVLKHFERVVLNRSVICDRSLRSSVESELLALSSFFSQSCRPGDWLPSDYAVLDKRFKKVQYRNLCSLCDSPNGCSYNPQNDGNQYATLDCLTKRGGDIAYVAKYYARLYFGLQIIEGYTSRKSINVNDYKYLCPDGSTRNIDSKEPCTWIAQPWDSIVTRSEEIATGLSPELQKYLPTEQLRASRDEWIDTFIRIVVGKDNKVFLKERVFNLREYIEAGREIPEEGKTLPCENPIRWCTVSDKETEKCEWLKEAGLIQGIVPELKCIQGSSKRDCLKKLQNGEADIMGIDTNLGTIANHYYNLTSVLYQETDSEANNRIVAIVNNDVTAQSMEDLKDKKACFPEFGGLAWTAFTHEIDNPGKDYCPYDRTLGNFFNRVCAPGATLHLEANSTVQRKFCNLCYDAFAAGNNGVTTFIRDESCNVTNKNRFYGDLGALRCLATGVADVAFVNAYALKSYIENDELPGNLSGEYSILCKNGKKIPLNGEIDDNCAIITVTGGELIARRSSTNMQLRDLGITMETYADSFGYYNRHYINIFHMFEPFDGEVGLLFRNQTLQFVTIHDRNDDPYVAMKNYAELIKKAEKCGENQKSAAETTEVRISAITFMALAVVLQIVLMF